MGPGIENHNVLNYHQKGATLARLRTRLLLIKTLFFTPAQQSPSNFHSDAYDVARCQPQLF